jgi:hypothetical protein
MIFFAIFTAPGDGVTASGWMCCKRHIEVVRSGHADPPPPQSGGEWKKCKYSDFRWKS